MVTETLVATVLSLSVFSGVDTHVLIYVYVYDVRMFILPFVGVHVCMCGGQRTGLDVGPHLLPCLRQDLLFQYVRLARSRASRAVVVPFSNAVTLYDSSPYCGDSQPYYFRYYFITVILLL